MLARWHLARGRLLRPVECCIARIPAKDLMPPSKAKRPQPRATPLILVVERDDRTAASCENMVLDKAVVQSCLFKAKSYNRVLKNQWLASLNFPVLGNLHQSPVELVLK